MLNSCLQVYSFVCTSISMLVYTCLYACLSVVRCIYFSLCIFVRVEVYLFVFSVSCCDLYVLALSGIGSALYLFVYLEMFEFAFVNP